MTKERKLRILEDKRPLETNHEKHLKKSNTEFKITINYMLEAFSYDHMSTE